MQAPRSVRGAVGSSLPLVVGLLIQAVATYLTLIAAARLLGAVQFGAVSALYVLLSSVAAGLFIPLEQEIARRRGVERSTGRADQTLLGRGAALAVGGALALDFVALLAHSFLLRVLGGHVSLLAALCVALPGYACCFVARGAYAGSRDLNRYGLQLAVEGVFRLVGVIGLIVTDTASVAWTGWIFAAAPWLALAVSLAGYGHLGRAPGIQVAKDGLGPALGWLVISSLAAQLLIFAGPLVVQVLARPDERASAGAFLAALVVVRIPVVLFTAVQPSFLPAMAAHAAADRKRDFLRLTSRVLALCGVLTVTSTVVLVIAGPWLLRVLFGFHEGLGSWTFLAMGLSVGLFLAAAILAQALLGRGWHVATTVGWLVGVAGLVLGTAVPGGAVGRATSGFLLGAVFAAGAFAVLFGWEIRRWSVPDGTTRRAVDQPENRRRSR